MGFFSKSKKGKHGKSKKKKGGKSHKHGGKKSGGENNSISKNSRPDKHPKCCPKSDISLDSDHLVKKHTPIIRLQNECKTFHPPCEEEDTEDELEEQENKARLRRARKNRSNTSNGCRTKCCVDDDKLDSCEECETCCGRSDMSEDHLCGECPHSKEKLIFPSIQDLPNELDEDCDKNIYETFNENRIITRLGYNHYKETVNNTRRADRMGPIRSLESIMCECESADCNLCNPCKKERKKKKKINKYRDNDSFGGCDPCQPKPKNKCGKKKKRRDTCSVYSQFTQKSSRKPCYSEYEDACHEPKKIKKCRTGCDASSFKSIQSLNNSRYTSCRNSASCDCGCTQYSSRRGGRPSRNRRRSSDSSSLLNGLIEIPAMLMDVVHNFVCN